MKKIVSMFLAIILSVSMLASVAQMPCRADDPDPTPITDPSDPSEPGDPTNPTDPTDPDDPDPGIMPLEMGDPNDGNENH
jgi:hypothetical protein